MTIAEISAYFHQLNPVSITTRLAIAAIFGAFLGMDRARKNRPAGFRTHMLVCVGACLVMLTNQYLISIYPGIDPGRLGAQVISGIGFLGAGTIIVTRRNQVMGLTTAAGLWADACIGLAIGAGFYTGAIVGGLLILFIVVVMQGIDEALQSYSKYLQIYAEFSGPDTLSRLLSFTAQNGIEIQEVEIVQARNKDDHIGAMINLKLPEKTEHAIVVEQLRKVEGVVHLDEL